MHQKSLKGFKPLLEPLKIGCTSSDCEKGLHCFKMTRKMAKADRGKCRSCGADLVDWGRVHERNLGDMAFTVKQLKYELVRHHYWHKEIDTLAVNHARRKGRIALKEAVRSRIEKSVGPAKPFHDGYQTPESGNIIYYAQHAMACCCRTCIEYWHGIPKGVELSQEQVNYLVDLAMAYIDARMPYLVDLGERVPSIRRQSTAGDLECRPGS